MSALFILYSNVRQLPCHRKAREVSASVHFICITQIRLLPGQQLKVFTAWRQALKMPDTEEQTPVMQPVISPPSTTVPQPVTSRSKATAPQAVVQTQSVTTPGTLVHSQSAASLQPAALASRGATEVSKGQQADVKVCAHCVMKCCVMASGAVVYCVCGGTCHCSNARLRQIIYYNKNFLGLGKTTNA